MASSLKEITIPVRLDAATFRRFALFNVFRRQRGWVRPLVFCCIFTAFAVVCLLSGLPQSRLLGGVLLAVGLGLPLVYIGSYLSQIRAQIKKARLVPARLVYTVKLRRLGVHVEQAEGKDRAELPWEKLYAACRVRGAIYLYTTPGSALLLPDGQGDAAPEETWQLLTQYMPEGKCHLYR